MTVAAASASDDPRILRDALANVQVSRYLRRLVEFLLVRRRELLPVLGVY